MSELSQPRVDRWVLINLSIVLLVLALGASIAYRAFGEQSFKNEYGSLADAFLHGRLFVQSCIDKDCAVHAGKTWVVFPPLPAVIAMPFVAIFGTGFRGFIALSAALTALAAGLWFLLFRKGAATTGGALLTTAIVIFGSPVYFIVISADGVWFFAQAVAFLFVTLSFHEARCRRLFNAGACLGLAVLSRQLVIALAPFIFLLSYEAHRSLFAVDRIVLRRALAFGIPVAIAILLYLAYNEARFGQPFETGYRFITFDPSNTASPVAARLASDGFVSRHYVLSNAAYLFVQGFHVEFSGPAFTSISGLDPFGTSLLAASPYLLLLLFMPITREAVVGVMTIGVMIGPMLFYHSNGFFQLNVQRYTLDWLPIALLGLPMVLITTDRVRMMRLLGMVAVGLNAITFAIAERHNLLW